LALQGAVREHCQALISCGATPVAVKYKQELASLKGLVIPGGESTTVGKLLERYGLLDEIRDMGRDGFPIFGTCTGLILLAKEIRASAQPRLGLMDITVERNAFGRQIASFEQDLDIPELGPPPFHAVFIRAPYIVSARSGVEVLAKLDGKIVLARQGPWLAASFHPELTPDLRLHRYFLEVCCGALPLEARSS